MADASDRKTSDGGAGGTVSVEKAGGNGEERSTVSSTQSTTSWLKESLFGLPKKLLSSFIPQPDHESKAESEEPLEITTTELKVVGEDKWVVLESGSASSLSSREEEDMSASASSESRSRNHLQPEAAQVNGGTPGSHRKRLGTGGSRSASSTPQPGTRANSISKGQKLTRPGSPHSQPSSATHSPVQRKMSGKNTRPVNLEVQNGGGVGSNGANGSPSGNTAPSGRIRSSSPPRGMTSKSSSSSLRSSSPTNRASPTQGTRGEAKGTASQQRSASPTQGRSSSPIPRGSAAGKNGKASSLASSSSSGRSSPPVRSSTSKTDLKGDSKSTSGAKTDGKQDSGKPPSGKTATDLKKSSQRTSSPSLSTQGSSNGINSGGGSFRKKRGILVNSSVDVTAAASGSSSQSSSNSGGLSNGRVPQVSSVVASANSRNHPVPTISLPKENGTAGGTTVEKGGSGEGSSSSSSSSAFEKVRDTLRISRPKKKKGKKLAYSIVVDPAQSTPEINLHDNTKYQDPFETSFAENGETEKKLDHDFKPASIPHNKPEYCDHCGDMAWGLYRQVLKCSRCNFVTHRKCEHKIQMACSTRMEQAILQHDKQVEDVERIAAVEQVDDSSKEPDPPPTISQPTPPPPTDTPTPSSSSTSTSSSASATPSSVTMATSASSSSTPNPISSQLMAEKTKLSRKIREYNRKTTPVHHIHIKSTHQAADPSNIEYHGFVRVHMSVQRPIHVSTAITRTSWYRLMRPVKERTLNDDDGYDIQTAFYLPLDTNRLVHIQNTTTTKELIQILLKKFCVTDNPKKFSLYEEYGSDCRRLFEEDRPLEISLDASVSHRNSKLVLRDNTYSTIQWDAFSAPELGNFIQILQREEELYVAKMEERFSVWRKMIQQTLKDKCMEEQAKKTKKSVSSRLSKSKLSPKPGRKASKTPSPKTVGKKSGK